MHQGIRQWTPSTTSLLEWLFLSRVCCLFNPQSLCSSSQPGLQCCLFPSCGVNRALFKAAQEMLTSWKLGFTTFHTDSTFQSIQCAQGEWPGRYGQLMTQRFTQGQGLTEAGLSPILTYFKKILKTAYIYFRITTGKTNMTCFKIICWMMLCFFYSHWSQRNTKLLLFKNKSLYVAFVISNTCNMQETEHDLK